MHFEIQNIFSCPIYVKYIKIIDTSKNITFYYSDDLLIINNYNGFANLYSDAHHIKINRLYNINSSNIFNTIYKLEIQYAVMWTDGSPSYIETDVFYTNHSIGVPLLNQDPTIILPIYSNKNDNKYRDLIGNIINNPIIGNIYIYNGKKIIYKN